VSEKVSRSGAYPTETRFLPGKRQKDKITARERTRQHGKTMTIASFPVLIPVLFTWHKFTSSEGNLSLKSTTGGDTAALAVVY